MGTRSAENDVKIISIRKAGREGQSADVVSDEKFKISLDSRLRKRR